jgi:hypothetical protein
MTRSATAARRRPWRWFGAWLLVGATYGVSVIGMASIGILVLPIALIGTGLLALVPWTRRGLPGLISGFGLPLLSIASLNRAGPGDVCRRTLTGEECVQEFSPWPWLTAAVILVVAGGVVFLLNSARRTNDG